MIHVLSVINRELASLRLPYTFNQWDSEIELPQFIGEISEASNGNEDGKNTYSLILTGYGTSYEELFQYSEQIKGRYKPSAVVDGVVIIYENTVIVDNGTEDLKQIQTTLTLKEWRV